MLPFSASAWLSAGSMIFFDFPEKYKKNFEHGIDTTTIVMNETFEINEFEYDVWIQLIM